MLAILLIGLHPFHAPLPGAVAGWRYYDCVGVLPDILLCVNQQLTLVRRRSGTLAGRWHFVVCAGPTSDDYRMALLYRTPLATAPLW